MSKLPKCPVCGKPVEQPSRSRKLRHPECKAINSYLSASMRIIVKMREKGMVPEFWQYLVNTEDIKLLIKLKK